MSRLSTGVSLIVISLQATSVCGAADKTSLSVVSNADWPAFKMIADRGVEALKSRGYAAQQVVFSGEKHSPNVFEKSGLADNPNRKQFIKQVTALLKDDAKSNVLQLVDHGSMSAGSELPSAKKQYQQSIYLPGYKIPMSEISQLVKDNKRPSKNLKVIASMCFAGGIHQIAVDNPNTCSLSAVDKDTYRMHKGVMNPFDGAVLGRLSERSGTLFDSYIAGVHADLLNHGRAKLSSMYYAQKVIGGQSMSDDVPVETNLSEHLTAMDKTLKGSKFGSGMATDAVSTPAFSMGGMMPGPFGGMMDPPEMSRAPSSGILPTDSCQTESGLAAITKIGNALNKLESASELKLELDEKDVRVLPPQYQTAYRNLHETMQVRFAKASEDLQAKRKQVARIRELWTQKSAAYQNCLKKEKEAAPCDKLYGPEFLTTNASVRRELSEVQAGIPEIQKYANVIRNFRNVATVLQTGSSEQKAKMNELLACESEPL